MTVFTGEALRVEAELLVCTSVDGGHVGVVLMIRIEAQEKTCKFFEKKFYGIDHQHGGLVTWLQAKNFSMKPVFFVYKCKLSLPLLYLAGMLINKLSKLNEI